MKQKSRIAMFALMGLAALGAVVGISSCRNDALTRLGRTRAVLRKEGFKLDITDFDLTISPEDRARAVALDACGKASYLGLSEGVDWLPPVGTNAALVMWDKPELVMGRCTNLWLELRRTLNHAALERACEALFSGPHRSLPPVVKGNSLSFPGGGTERLGCPLAARAMLALHEKDRAKAWTNLYAFTRLVAEWGPEQFDPNFYYWRHTDLVRAYGATWQAVQAGGWTDAHLAALQREWETADTRRGLPERMAFARAYIELSSRGGSASGATWPGLREFRRPGEAWRQIKAYFVDAQYRRTGTYLEEDALLRLSWDREKQSRQAEGCSCWKEIKALPGISSWPVGMTNLVPSLTNDSLARPWILVSARSWFDTGDVLDELGIRAHRLRMAAPGFASGGRRGNRSPPPAAWSCGVDLLARAAVTLAGVDEPDMNSKLILGMLSLTVGLELTAAPADPTLSAREELYGLGAVGAIAVQPDGKFVVCIANGDCLLFVNQRTGVFGWIPGRVFRFENDGSVDRSFRSELQAEPLWPINDWCLSLQPDGKLLAPGQKERIGLLAPDGRLEQTFPLQPPQASAPPVWAQPLLLRPCALGPAGEIVVRGVCPDRDAGHTNGWDCYTAPLPAVHWFDSTGRFLHSSPWTEHAPELAAELNVDGIGIRHILWYDPRHDRPQQAFIYMLPTTPLEKQFADPAVAALLRKVAEELPLSLCRYAVRLPDGGVVLPLCLGNGIRTGCLVRFDPEWRRDPSFLARYQTGDYVWPMELACDQRGGILVIGWLAKLNGQSFTGLARLLPDGTTDPAFRVCFTNGIPNSSSPPEPPGAIAVQQDGRILIGGMFTAVNGVPCSSLARLNPDGSLDREFTARFSNARFEEVKRRFELSRIELAGRPKPAAASSAGSASDALHGQGESSAASQTIADSTLLVAPGNTTSGKGDELYRLLPVAAIVVQPDSKILVRDKGGLCMRFLNQRTGVFGTIPGGIFRFESDGSVDHGFRCELKEEQSFYMWDRGLAVQPDGKPIGLDKAGHVRRLMANGKLDPTFAQQAAGTEAPPVWSDPRVVRPFGLGPAGEILVRDDWTNWNAVVASGWDRLSGPGPVVRWFGSTGQFLRATSWTEQRPSLAAHLDEIGIYVCRAHPSFIGITPHPTEVSYRPLETPLEEQLADPAVGALLRRITDELPLSLWRYAARLPDGGVVLAVDERNGPGRGRLVRFDGDWRWDRGFIARFQSAYPAISLQLAPDQRGGLFVTGPLATLNGREFGGLARLRPDGTMDPAFQVHLDAYAPPQVPALLHVPFAIAVQPDGRVLVGGDFFAINGIRCTSLARLNPDGSVDRDFSDRFSFERFEEAKQRLSVSRLEIAARPTPAVASTTGSVAGAPGALRESPGRSQTICVRQLEVIEGAAVIDYDGAPSATYILQAAESINAPGWSNIATNQTDAAGRGQFKDTSAATAPGRFYRVLSLR